MAAPQGIEDVLPLSPLQQGLLYHSGFGGTDAGAYVLQTAVELTGALDAEALHAAADAVMVRHPGLRCAFREVTDGRTVQIVARGVVADWTTRAPAGQDARENEAAYAEIAAAERLAGFDLRRPPLLRFTLMRLSESRHRLLLTYHHIAIDGWSLSLVLKELFRLYRPGSGPAEGVESAVLGPAVPFREHLAWLGTRDRAAAVHAWRTALDGLAGPCLARRAIAGHGGAQDELAGQAADRRWVALDLPHTLGRELTPVARGIGVTINTVVQFAWAVLLERLTGTRDAVFGVTVSGREPQLPGSESMVGLLINTLPARFAFADGESAAQALRRLQAEQAELLPHQHLGLAEVQREAGVGALFDTVVVFESYPMDVAGLLGHIQDLRVEGLHFEASGHYPMALIAIPGPVLRLRLEYDGALLSAAEAQTLLARVHRVLWALAVRPDGLVDHIDVLSAEERTRSLVGHDSPAREVAPATFAQLFEEQAGATPDAVALVAGPDELTYRELNARANRIARLLVGLGAGPETVVALALARATLLPAALLGVAKSGAAFLVLDPGQPAERTGEILRDSRPLLILTDGRTAITEQQSTNTDGDTDRRPPVVVRLDDEDIRARISSSPDTDLEDAERTAPSRLENPAYVVYTSGSSGRPKGVVVTHTGIAGLGLLLPVPADGRVLQFLSLSFDASIADLCLAWFSGAALVLVPDEQRAPGPGFAELVRQYAATHVLLTPSLLATVPADALPRELVIVVGGEPLPADLAEEWAGGGRVLMNQYGPTEATVCAVSHGPVRPDGAPVPIGRPVCGARAYVLDRRLRPVPDGVAAELYLAGPGLARGYLGAPGQSAERFVADPFALGGGRMYRTGDLVRRRADGTLEFLGRDDDQAKVRGHRVEPAETAAALERDPRIAEARVLVREDQPGRPRLVGYVVPVEGCELEPASVRAGLRERLPDYLVPSAVIVLERLPLGPTGKLDRRALPAPDEAPSRPPLTLATPRQDLLCRLFAEVLGRSRVGVDEDFFDAGGDSLSATRLIARVRAETGLEQPISALYETGTVAAFDRRLDGAVRRTRPALRRMR